MAIIKPFKGILYNPEIIQDPADVTTPPYDVISNEAQEVFHKRHPNNVIRLILGKTKESDTKINNAHTRAATSFNNWLSDNILIKDDNERFYLKSIQYEFGGETLTRYGLITLVGLEPFEKGIIMPHEKTFSKVKSERLRLMKASHCNFCPIFALYPDNGDVFNALKSQALQKVPDMAFTDDQGHLHKLWKISDPVTIKTVSEAMKEKHLFIADGHHRYETALNYRDHIAENTPDFDENHPSNFVLMYLCSMQDPGLIILPAHRLLKGISNQVMASALKNSSEYFHIESFEFTNGNLEQAKSSFTQSLEKNADKNAIGVFIKNSSEFHLMVLKSGVMEAIFNGRLDKALYDLDVSVLTRLVFMKILGFDQSRLDDATRIGYASTYDKAVAHITDKDYDVAFILNPTRIEQVQRIAEKGLIMPRKSTYFYPKVKSGIVMHSLVS